MWGFYTPVFTCKMHSQGLLWKSVFKKKKVLRRSANHSISWPLFVNLGQHNTSCGKLLGRILSLREVSQLILVLRPRCIWMSFVFTLGVNTVVTDLLYTCYRLNMTFCMKKCMFVAWKNGPVRFIRRCIRPLFLLYSSFFHWCWCFCCTLKLAMNSGLRNEWEMLQFFRPFTGVKCLKYQGL